MLAQSLPRKLMGGQARGRIMRGQRGWFTPARNVVGSKELLTGKAVVRMQLDISKVGGGPV